MCGVNDTSHVLQWTLGVQKVCEGDIVYLCLIEGP